MDATIFPTMFGYPHIPVSPPSPPDHRLLFNKHPLDQQPSTDHLTHHGLFRHFVKEMEAPVVRKAPSLLEKHHQERQQLREQDKLRMRPEAAATQKTDSTRPSEHSCSTPSTSASTLASSPTSEPSSAETKVSPEPLPAPCHLPQSHQTTQAQPQAHPQSQTTSAPPPPPPPVLENPFLTNQSGLNLLDASLCTDPKYVAMVSRMAAYYQQRCQAILNFQQQRCQAWATAHRQKCHESMQAAMLVVAWYIRDRIGRRRRRGKRAFRRGLRDKNYRHAMAGRASGSSSSGNKAGESRVRKWVDEIPEAGRLAPSEGGRHRECMDREEREFDVDKEVPKDKESQLFAVADRMIKNQLAKIDVPLLGALNLEDSDCESDSDDERYYEPEEYDMEDGEEEGEEYEDDAECGDESEGCVEDAVSKEAMHGTGKGSLKRKRGESMY